MTNQGWFPERVPKPIYPDDPGRCRAISDVLLEREYQDEKWGGPSHDDTETEGSWEKYISEYNNAQGRAVDYDFRTRMIKVAALAVAAIESHDRRTANGVSNVVDDVSIRELAELLFQKELQGFVRQEQDRENLMAGSINAVRRLLACLDELGFKVVKSRH